MREISALRQEAVDDGVERPMPPHPRWKPLPGDDYYFIGNAGDVYDDGIDEYFGRGGALSNSRAEIGNLFAKADGAFAAVMRLKTLAEMREWAGKWDDKFVLIYIGNDDRVSVSTILIRRNTFGELRFATKEDAENCIKAIGKDRLKKYYFMIPEEKHDDD